MSATPDSSSAKHPYVSPAEPEILGSISAAAGNPTTNSFDDGSSGYSS